MSDDTDEIKERLLAKRDKAARFTESDYLSTGSTLLNLACSGKPRGGFIKGHYYHFVGDSSSGKTFLCLTCLAEASINKSFNNYRLIHDDAENGALFDFEKFFGPKMAARVQPPAGTQDNPQYSVTVEDFYDHLDNALAKGPCIYVCDSMDVLVPRDDQKKYDKQKNARRKLREGKKVQQGEDAGSFGMAKAKLNSQLLRTAVPKLKQTGSILIIVGQTRDKPAAGGPFANRPGADNRTGGGGHALKFYSTLQLWSSVQEKIFEKIKGKNRELGIKAKVRIKKNRQTGRDRSAVIPIFHSFGIDDVGACVDYLIDEGHWKDTQNGIRAPEFDFVGKREKLIRHIEDEDGEREIQMLVAKRWREIEDACQVERKNRYG